MTPRQAKYKRALENAMKKAYKEDDYQSPPDTDRLDQLESSRHLVTPPSHKLSR